ncbi:putative DNA modification/repair radical SAM protein [candidate division WOR-1 bacterium RIFOXYA12_FULL_52_29]|uniref:Putative DNA modification/repair radical SAM protein n=1 Tax=candidate division WOR-1 bacterium RIFOXYC12_FULL_54_18 TaxID=1802584 RepID=A0A1F4T7S5_UNCSA|nr:MAG: putative DNA modification/repair radical SAM protein [candidate division WOR-1 bacterium RIFOXYA2_FULL_51_19]OGC18347.1 MAG: putative DNA modification/repair radical SAM protein [candidate division WOR-1 bacterium RIFOXYA12_FULL_52_29]OGC27202.1 MAG: putative DNA modification/repair radical SAM protein [candidate division WOR-1 bacterium RIFOXYB2_FULL_45_9]OGC28764.1 MAG: putative DNA modification/repair radical SAM protein [candidate division WOR-1 bacterium RIFOXYC12_FULL_54_18]OGC307
MPDTEQKLEILGAAAKYDICASSAAPQKRQPNSNYIGSNAPGGICHSYTPDGRCVSLLKVLMTNSCKNNCQYCVNRASNDFKRSSFEPKELADLFIELYRRNYIEGIFLSSGVQKSAVYTMERMIAVLEILRFQYRYRGYVHLKALPHTPADLIERGARLADRMSVNLESPNPDRLKSIAGEKNFMLDLVAPINAIQKQVEKGLLKAGQTTQFVVGAAGETDAELLRTTNWLYKKKNLKRVYFSAFVPTVPDHLVPQSPIPLLREHRLYQADWLMRFYNFQLEDLVLKDDHNLSLDLDPKMAHALKNRERFPLEINRASYQDLLKVPGIGPLAAKRLYRARKEHHFTNLQELKNLGVVTKRAKPFILINGVKQGNISEIVTVKQLELFEGYSSSLAWAQAPQLLT